MNKLRMNPWVLSAALLLLAGVVGCGDDDDDSSPPTQDGGQNDGGPSAGNGGKAGKGGNGGKGGSSAGTGGEDEDSGVDEAGSGGSGGSGEPPDEECPALEDRDEVLLDEEIEGELHWTCDKTYILASLTFVINDSTLTIDPGTVIKGDPETALIITRGSKLISEGTKDAPIVFTSSEDEGDRASGDWGGVILLGGAEINITGGENQIEGIDPTDPRGVYGGGDNESNCGSIKYTRIEFTGYELMLDFELQGLTMGGCGSDTEISYLQVHRSKDDGIEIFGGRPNLDHIVLTGNEDDSFDTAEGFVGKVQFMVAQHIAPEADTGFEFDNQEGGEDASPRNAPSIYNVTLIGSGDTAGTNGMVLRRGTNGTFGNLIVMGYPTTGVDIRDVTTVAGTEADPIALSISNSLFFDNGPGGDDNFADAEPTDGTAADNDGSFDESAFLSDADYGNVVGEDPELGDAYNVTAPDFVPAEGSPAAEGAAPPSGFDTSATYMGAFEPGGDDWTADWTAYPED